MTNDLLTANETLQQFRHLTTPNSQLRTTPEMRLLLSLSQRNDQPTPSTFAQEWHVSRAAVTKAIAGLVADDLVEKVVNPKDKRSFAITLTPTGQVEASALKTLYLAQVTTLQQQMGQGQFVALITLLEAANQALTAAE